MSHSTRYILLFLLGALSFRGAVAQINFTFTETDAGCNGSSLGKIIITVSQTNPPYTYSWSNGETSNVVEDLAVGTYTLTITDDTGADTTLSFSITEVECEMLPDIAFTPNGDGYNDTWFIQNAQYFDNALVQVFDRLGALVFESDGLYKAWDGKNKLGIPVPDSSYYYLVYKKKDEKSNIKKGTVSILR